MSNVTLAGAAVATLLFASIAAADDSAANEGGTASRAEVTTANREQEELPGVSPSDTVDLKRGRALDEDAKRAAKEEARKNAQRARSRSVRDQTTGEQGRTETAPEQRDVN